MNEVILQIARIFLRNLPVLCINTVVLAFPTI